MDPTDGSLDSVFGTIGSEEPGVDVPTQVVEPTQKTETETEANSVEAPQAEAEVAETETKTEPLETGDQTQVSEPQTETNTETETKTQNVEDWKKFLPPQPVLHQIVEPTFDENGNVTNMDAKQYADYITQRAENAVINKNYEAQVEAAAFAAAEQLLPSLKTDPGIQQLVYSIRAAAAISGNPIDTVQAAQQVKSIVDGARQAGAAGAKTTITRAKAAAVEAGNPQAAPDKPVNKRMEAALRGGHDVDAFADLFDQWDKEGKI